MRRLLPFTAKSTYPVDWRNNPFRVCVSRLTARISFLAPVHVYPGEDELEALAQNALGALGENCRLLFMSRIVC